MNKVKLREKFNELKQQRKALLATNFYNLETLQGVVRAAKAADQSIILQLTKSSIDYMGLPVAVELADTIAKEYGINYWLHLDHGDSYELAARCLDAGFDSVMIDASEKPFEENIKQTSEVVQLAKKYGACVEAELGYIAKLGQNSETQGFTNPQEAKTFVEQTGVDTLAVAIGSAHGFYKKTPKLDIERLGAISMATNIPLVLHGASGIPHETLSTAIAKGICKINLATEIKNIFMQTLKARLTNEDEIDLRKIFPSATDAVTNLVQQKLDIFR